jgi:biotin carboxyl carrier protein
MKLKAESSGNEHELALNLNSGSFEIDGRHYDVEVRSSSPGEYLLKSGDHVYKCRVESKQGVVAGIGTFEVMVRSQNYDVTVTDPKRLRSGQAAASHHAGAAEIVSPMPGKIVRVLVEAGAEVEVGAGIIVVEAMKMQNEMKAPKAGVVVSINAAEGATVNAGDVLAVIE